MTEACRVNPLANMGSFVTIDSTRYFAVSALSHKLTLHVDRAVSALGVFRLPLWKRVFSPRKGPTSISAVARVSIAIDGWGII